ncbi:MULTISPECIES: ATP-binding protein [unclassified Rhizobium]|jgi:signal transduction histidine kinase|uniref:HAMP domain-containing sensor histidine kinase n=1 Tax=unclassified Rhizobium TaxID=2613769 RepID=UPI0006465B8D|nr:MULTISPECIES: ATP-binding protein [unclassified Rhizobium]MBN8951414.1 HAMP domain-containing protein [Rhizobium tropici]OJY74772.1 MAG: two-component sensor histidine kinase [Rhizobium sp. 60-20]RKD66717.1 signal transduction histidine kinase [Rhizobium sp. WW_1]
MRQGRLLRSTPFRLALSFGLFFIVAFLITGLVAYGLMKRELARSLDVSIQDTYSVVASTFSSNDLEDLVAAVSTYSALKRPEDQVFLLLDPGGRKLAGNVQAARLEPGITTISATLMGLEEGDPIRVMAGNIGGNSLVVGQSYREIDRIEEIALMSFFWASIIIVATVVLGGTLLARRTQRRLEAIESTMIEVSAGNLSRRIPTRGDGDDIDVVSTHMNEALARLSGLVEGMRQVSADIAHDLKTPLNRLGLTIEQSLQRLGESRDVEDLMFDARDEIARINATFEALLRISQIEAGARKTRFKAIDLGQIMASVAEIYAEVAEDSMQALTLTPLAAGPCMINGDRELLTQLFVNLVENAITHCPAGTTIVMSLTQDAHHYRACVSDSGPGIPEAERELVFRRLYRLDKSRTTPGNGLGLSLVKAIADLHAARIALDDNRPGLQVKLYFPRI